MKKILGACVGSCVHIAGVLNFLSLAARQGYDTKFAGSALSIEKLKEEILDFKPHIVAISYRLSPESVLPVFNELKEQITDNLEYESIEFILGTTVPVAKIAKKLNMFKIIFTGQSDKEEVEKYLGREKIKSYGGKPPQTLIKRIEYCGPLPLIRHHFGRPTLKETLEGVKKISSSGLLDIISIGPDQNTQEYFFEPGKMDPKQDGAGGVPLRSEEDFKRLFLASRTGNYPLMRCYSGTNNIIRMAEILIKNLNNAWCAVPLCWYNQLDNRSDRNLEESIFENQQVMKWHAEKNIPVEVNESHHWSLRYSPDSIAVATAFLAAYNAKKMGVKDYVAQYMFNTPPETSFLMDLAKMLAKIELIESLHDFGFKSICQTRTGLYSYSADYYEGKGQLASSTMLQMQLSPKIVHVVAYCEADHAAKPEDITESVKIVKKIIENHLYGIPDMTLDGKVIKRKEELIREAKMILDKIRAMRIAENCQDPLSSPAVISNAIRKGILDAPHLCGNRHASGIIRTMFVNGKNLAVDKDLKILSEEERLDGIKT